MNVPIAVQVMDIEIPLPPPLIETAELQQNYLEQIYELEEDKQKLKTVIAFILLMLIVAIIIIVINNTYKCSK
jgi:hypothetical protein